MHYERLESSAPRVEMSLEGDREVNRNPSLRSPVAFLFLPRHAKPIEYRTDLADNLFPRSGGFSRTALTGRSSAVGRARRCWGSEEISPSCSVQSMY